MSVLERIQEEVKGIERDVREIGMRWSVSFGSGEGCFNVLEDKNALHILEERCTQVLLKIDGIVEENMKGTRKKLVRHVMNISSKAIEPMMEIVEKLMPVYASWEEVAKTMNVPIYSKPNLMHRISHYLS